MISGRHLAGISLAFILLSSGIFPSVAAQDTVAPPVPFRLGVEADDPVLSALRQRRLALDSREADLELRALELKAVERRIEARITILGQLAKQAKSALAKQTAAEQRRLKGLARSYEAMRPAEAAGLLDQLEPELRVAIASYMRQAKLGPVLARMIQENARQITIGIAGNQAQIRTYPGKGS